MRDHLVARWIRGFAVLSILGLASCSPSGPKLHPVTGQVLYDDRPAAGATIVLHLNGGGPDSPRPGAIVKDDGTFSLNTYPYGAGAPEGEYTVLITWFEDPKVENAEARSRLPSRYADPAKSGLKASVKPGSNSLEPFRLYKVSK
jgi:hypothetical protein